MRLLAEAVRRYDPWLEDENREDVWLWDLRLRERWPFVAAPFPLRKPFGDRPIGRPMQAPLSAPFATAPDWYDSGQRVVECALPRFQVIGQCDSAKGVAQAISDDGVIPPRRLAPDWQASVPTVLPRKVNTKCEDYLHVAFVRLDLRFV